MENCIVIAPDGWDISSKPLQKEYDATTWEQAKAAGLVCLPAAGGRDGSSLDDVGVCGYYWSSSARNESRAYFVQFASAAVHAYADGAFRRSGFSVRLVTDVSTPAPAESKYVEIEAKYDGTNITKLKWNKQNLSITDSGKKAWKGGNNSAVKVPGTDDDVKVGDYFQWGASYEGYGITDVAKQKPESLLIYTEFTNTGCGDTKDEFTFIGSKQFDQNNAPYGGTSYTKYTSSNEPTLGKSDDVANIILGGNWRMPTKEEFQALFNATYWVWDGTDKGYYVFVPDESHIAGNIDGSIPSGWSKSTALLFFPAAGRGNGTSFSDVGSYGYCWSNTLSPFFPNIACNLDFDISGVGPLVTNFRYCGLSIRPVSD